MAGASHDDTPIASTPPHVVARPLDDETVLLNLDTETYFGLDEVGTRMLEVLRESASIDAAVTQLLSEYDTDEATLRSDLQALLTKLAENGLVELPEG